MTTSLSGFSVEHEIKLTQHAAQVLANQYKQDLPPVGHEVLLHPDFKNKEDPLDSILLLQNIGGTLVLTSDTHICEQWPEIFGLDSETGLPITDYRPATSIPVRKEQGERVAYVNSFYDRNNPRSQRTFETDVKPEEYRGYLIFHRVDSMMPVEDGSHVFDVVKPESGLQENGGRTPLIGVCISQTAGPSAARKVVDKILDAATPDTTKATKGRKP